MSRIYTHTFVYKVPDKAELAKLCARLIKDDAWFSCSPHDLSIETGKKSYTKRDEAVFKDIKYEVLSL